MQTLRKADLSATGDLRGLPGGIALNIMCSSQQFNFHLCFRFHPDDFGDEEEVQSFGYKRFGECPPSPDQDRGCCFVRHAGGITFNVVGIKDVSLSKQFVWLGSGSATKVPNVKRPHVTSIKESKTRIIGLCFRFYFCSRGTEWRW